MAQEERKAKAVLAAAVELVERIGDSGHAPTEFHALREAVTKYNEVKSAELPADPGAFHCPNCGTDRPAYGWHFNIGDTGPFALQWITCFCGDCKRILGVSVVQFLPKQELVEVLKQQFAGKVGLA